MPGSCDMVAGGFAQTGAGRNSRRLRAMRAPVQVYRGPTDPHGITMPFGELIFVAVWVAGVVAALLLLYAGWRIVSAPDKPTPGARAPWSGTAPPSIPTGSSGP